MFWRVIVYNQSPARISEYEVGHAFLHGNRGVAAAVTNADHLMSWRVVVYNQRPARPSNGPARTVYSCGNPLLLDCLVQRALMFWRVIVYNGRTDCDGTDGRSEMAPPLTAR